MKILHVRSKQYEEAKISLIQKRDLTTALKKRFSFDWKKEELFDIYKLTKVNDKNILGLMSLVVVRSEFRVEIRLLESAKPNVGIEKEYDRIAGCLIAFACRLAFKLGFGGFVSLVPKTELIRHYMTKYHLFQMGKHLATDGENSVNLIAAYLEND